MTREERIVDAARACIGTAFRPQGRTPGLGLDCIGLAAVALRAGGVRIDAAPDYDLSGTHGERLIAAFSDIGLEKVPDGVIRAGDILLFSPGRVQHHVGIATGTGFFVHAHLGLRRTVETPMPAPWPLLGVWRLRAKDE